MQEIISYTDVYWNQHFIIVEGKIILCIYFTDPLNIYGTLSRFGCVQATALLCLLVTLALHLSKKCFFLSIYRRHLLLLIIILNRSQNLVAPEAYQMLNPPLQLIKFPFPIYHVHTVRFPTISIIVLMKDFMPETILIAVLGLEARVLKVFNLDVSPETVLVIFRIRLTHAKPCYVQLTSHGFICVERRLKMQVQFLPKRQG